MKTIYSIAAKLGGGGIGTTSFYAVAGLSCHHLLEKVFCCSYDLPKVRPWERSDLHELHETHAAVFERLSFLPQKYQWALKDYCHDLIVSRQLPSGDLFHGWNGHCLWSLRRAQKMGMIGVVERASSHPATYERLLKEEYARWGLKVEPILPWVKKRLLAELELADYITTPSAFAYQSLVENGVPEKKLLKIPFGAAPPRHSEGNARGIQAEGRGHFNVLFVGQVGIRKGVPYLLEAWKKLNLKEADLYLLGEVESAAVKVMAPYREDHRIHFVGYTDPRPYYEKADIFVFPSLEEGSALVTYEALAAGLPVLTTFNAGSVVEDGQEGFLVPAGEVDSLAERLKFLYEDEAARRQMGEKARIKAQRFSWEAYGEKLVEAYRKIAGMSNISNTSNMSNQ